jgi:hypothetical protein
MHVSVEEVQMLLGQKDVEIYALQRKVAALEAELLKLRPLPEKPQDSGKSLP